MSEVITIMVGDKIWLTYHPDSPLYTAIRKTLGIPELKLSSNQSTSSLVSAQIEENIVPKKLIQEKLFQAINFSSVWQGSDTYKRYQLNSVDSWIPEESNLKQLDTLWIQIVCSKKYNFVGLQLQGRGHPNYTYQMVTQFKVFVSDDGKKYIQAFGGKQFIGCKSPIKIQTVMFDEPLKTKFMRIKPTAYIGHPSLRFDALINDQ